MRTIWTRMAVAAACVCTLWTVAPAARQTSAATALRAAMDTETIKGDLNAALEMYLALAGSSDPQVAAQASTRLAAIRARLGEQQTRTLVWTDPSATRNSSPVVTPDGRYVAYTDAGAAYLQGLGSKETRRLVVAKDLQGHVKQFAFSGNASRVFFTWRDDRQSHDELRVVDLAGSGASKPRVIFRNEDIPAIFHPAVSSDGKWIAANLVRPDRSVQIGLISVENGSFRILKSIDWQGSERIAFSPDGRFLGIDLASNTLERKRDVFVLAVDGSREYMVSPSPHHEGMIGWTPDGRRVVFVSDRTGTRRLWSVPVTDSAAGRTPDLVQVAFPWTAAHISTDGGLYLEATDNGVRRAQVASFDFTTGRLLAEPVDVVLSGHRPAWSPDGKIQATVSSGVLLTSSAGDVVRQLRPALAYFNDVAWSPDGRFIAVNGSDQQGRRGVYRIDATTSEVKALAVTSDVGVEPLLVNWSRDGKSIYYLKVTNNQFAVVALDLSSADEHDVVRLSGNLISSSLSPDRQLVALTVKDPQTGSHSLVISPVGGGQPRTLLAGEKAELFMAMWSPDSHATFVNARNGTSQGELWRVSLDDGVPRQAETRWGWDGQVSVHPDGRQIAFVAAGVTTARQIWQVKNLFAPSTPSR